MAKSGVGACAIVLAAALTACSGAGASPAATAPPSSATTPAASTAGGTGNGPGFARGPSVAGTIQAVNGSTITVQDANGGTSTIQFASSTPIRKQVQETLSDVKPGVGIVAIGQENGGVLQARQIQVRTGQAPARSGTGPGRNGNAGNGNNGGGGNGNGNPPVSIVSGTVDSVTSNTITVKTADGSSAQVQLASNGRILNQQNASASDLKPGEYVLAFGQKQGSTLVASGLNLSDTPPGNARGAGG